MRTIGIATDTIVGVVTGTNDGDDGVVDDDAMITSLSSISQSISRSADVVLSRYTTPLPDDDIDDVYIDV
jgi:hypothetical protein